MVNMFCVDSMFERTIFPKPVKQGVSHFIRVHKKSKLFTLILFRWFPRFFIRSICWISRARISWKSYSKTILYNFVKNYCLDRKRRADILRSIRCPWSFSHLGRPVSGRWFPVSIYVLDLSGVGRSLRDRMASGFQTFSNARHRARQIRRLHRLLRFQHGSERFSFVACPAEHPHRHRLCGVDRHWRVGHVPGWYSVVRGFF